jgi:hypothetical protein
VTACITHPGHGLVWPTCSHSHLVDGSRVCSIAAETAWTSRAFHPMTDSKDLTQASNPRLHRKGADLAQSRESESHRLPTSGRRQSRGLSLLVLCYPDQQEGLGWLATQYPLSCCTSPHRHSGLDRVTSWRSDYTHYISCICDLTTGSMSSQIQIQLQGCITWAAMLN